MDLSYCRLILLLPSRLFLLSFKRLVSTAFPLMVRVVMKLLRMRMYLGLLAVVNANQVDLLDLLLIGEVHVFGQELMEKEMFSMRVYI
jgi:hypothetical protein